MRKNFVNYFLHLTSEKAILVLSLIGFIVYFNVLLNGFVGDDFGQIVDNNAIHSLQNLFSFFSSSTFWTGYQLTGIYYKPLTTALTSIIYNLSGGTAFLFHLIQIILFIANACLVYLIFEKFLQKKIAFILSIIFLVHPINAEVVEYISNLQDTLFFFFGASSLYLLTRDSPKIIPAFILMGMSLLSKETGILFLLINFLYIYLFKKKIRQYLYFIPVILIAYILLHFLVTNFAFIKPNIFHISRIPLTERLLNVPAIISFYITTFIFPKNLAISYDWIVNSINLTKFLYPLLFVLVFIIFLTALGFITKNKTKFKTFIFFLLWFLSGLALHLQIIPLDGTVATRWFYFPIVGLLGLIGISMEIILPRINKKFLPILVAIFLLISFPLGTRTIIRNMDFQNNMRLMASDTIASPNNFTLETIYGFLFLEKSNTNKPNYI